MIDDSRGCWKRWVLDWMDSHVSFILEIRQGAPWARHRGASAEMHVFNHEDLWERHIRGPCAAQNNEE